MAASDYVPISFKNRLHLVGRPQMSTRPSITVRMFADKKRYFVCDGHHRIAAARLAGCFSHIPCVIVNA